MKSPHPYQMRVDSIIDNSWNNIPDFTREEILNLRKKVSKGDQLSFHLLLSIWEIYVSPKLDAFYESDEGKILWRDLNDNN